MSAGNGTLLLPDKSQRPQHVAIIMDGNGRWATDRQQPRLEGHRKGADVVRDLTTFARELGIGHLTLYSFSRQNWRRPPTEVAGLMLLLEDYCASEHETLMKHQIRLKTIGELSRLPASTRRALQKAVDATAGNRMMTLTLAVDYGGREELVGAVKRLALDLRSKRLHAENIDESAISSRLDTAFMPDPDLLIRTSGELRISNFLLWQLAYAELHFTDVCWPDFTRAHFTHALWDFARRERRFGATAEQVTERPARAFGRDGFSANERADKDAGSC